MPTEDRAGHSAGDDGGRPHYGTRADYLEINQGTGAPASAGSGVDESRADLLDRLENIYGGDRAGDADRDATG